MNGFWISPNEVKKQTTQKKISKSQGPKLATCPCGLQATCKGPMMPVGGLGGKRILVITEAPGAQEDEAYAELLASGAQPVGTQLIGNAGQRVANELAENGIDLEEDCWKICAVNCRTPKNRTPTGLEITACRPRVLKAIQELKPKYILALGPSAIESLLGQKWHDEEGLGGIARWRGFQCPDQEYKAWICPTFLPSYVIRCETGRDPQIPLYFGIDIKRFADLVHSETEVPIYPVEGRVLFPTPQETIGLIRKLLHTPPEDVLYFDYETTGLKPHTPGHRIFSVSMCFNEDNAYSFLMDEQILPWWSKLLQSQIPKCAHNNKFEEKWSRALLGAHVENWVWDTQLAAHVLDNRGHISGLKFQTYTNFGIPDYSKEITPLLQADTSLGFNRIEDIPVDKLLLYGGYDSLHGFRLYKQQRQLLMGYEAGIDLLVEGSCTLMDDEENGVVISLDYLRKQKEFLTKRVEAVKNRIRNSEDGKLWAKTFPEINLNSNQQLAHLLHEVMKLPSVKTTKTGKPSVDEEALELLQNTVPLVQDIVEMRGLDKLRSTYLTGWETETGPDHIMRPMYSLHIAKTYRSSSSNPNLQNVPIRDKVAQRTTRRAVYPRFGHILVEADYSGIEVRISACYHKDPTMITYITDPTTDMHRDMAMECYLLEQEEVSKSCRQGSKNQYVFPSFYGSYWKNTAQGLWKWALDSKTAKGTDLLTHLKKKGIKGLGDPDARYPAKGTFLYHIKQVDERFWGERFRVYNQWKSDFWDEYLEKGYFDTLTGFTCQGPMRRNEVVNYPIQGSAFHCLLKSKANTKKWIWEMGHECDILPCGQIHDSGLFSVHPDILPEFASAVHQIWQNDLREQWPWIIVPLDVEIEATPVNGNWSQKKLYEGGIKYAT